MKWLLPRRRKTLRETRAEYLVPRGNQKFDESTGQIYTESIAAIQTTDDRNWARKGRLVAGPSYRDNVLYADYVKAWEKGTAGQDLGEYRQYLDEVKNSRAKGLKGARSLQDSAIECILENISDVTLEGIQCLPHQIVRQVWYAVNKRCTMCFNTWWIFSTLLHESEMSTLDLFRYREVITSPKSALLTYTSILTSDSFDFLTLLCITTAFPIPDFLKLTKITNLGALEIVHTDGVLRNSFGSETFTQGIGDRIIRAWQADAISNGAFRVLRILKLRNLEEVTHNSLSYVSSFPGLALYDVRGCRFGLATDMHAMELGWSILEVDVLEELDRQCNAQGISKQDHQISGVRSERRASSRPLWDTSKVHRISGAGTPRFLAEDDSQQKPNAPSRDLTLPAEKISKPKRPKKQSQDPPGPKAPKTWDFATSTAFARLGELRNDNDMSRAGVNIGDKAVVGDEIVNSIPMASICLGQAPSSFSRKQKGFTFLRVKVPPPTDAKMDSSTKGGHSNMAQGQNRRQGLSVLRAKKRKLDDVLGSFL